MKIIRLHFYLFMLYQTTAILTDTPVTLGADVIITCDLDIKEIYWYKEKLPDPPVLILRTFDSTYEGGKYENSNSEHKYSVKTNSSLLIRNITSDELGVYYCVKTSEPLKFSNGTKIHITDCVHKNQSSCESETHDHPTLWRNLPIIISVLLNLFLTFALIGLGKKYLYVTRRLKNNLVDSQNNMAAQNSTHSQYAGVDIPVRPSVNRTCQSDCIYSLLQPVNTT